jgi:hypothetical protein
MNILIFLISILILILITFYVKTKDHWYHLWKNGFDGFPLEQFFRECGNNFVLVGDYELNGQPNLISSRHFSIKLKDWLERNEIFDGNRQTKLTFFKNSKNPIAEFIKNWVKSNRHNFPKEFKNNDNDYCFSLRISRNKWEYPSHFDAVDNFTFVLCGTRNVILNKSNSEKIKLVLNENDILFFKNGVYHHFWCEEDNELNIVLNIVFDSKNKDIVNKFDENYPKRIEEIKLGLEYI